MQSTPSSFPVNKPPTQPIVDMPLRIKSPFILQQQAIQINHCLLFSQNFLYPLPPCSYDSSSLCIAPRRVVGCTRPLSSAESSSAVSPSPQTPGFDISAFKATDRASRTPPRRGVYDQQA
ncbi:hypothetical protein PMIN07_000696 [Paraphaeosphaeria minitans]